ncbi:DNA primase family protein [Halodesulfovibrio aestuarii]|uniref:Phage/plasmid primase, P4 family, C-terminal domain-containing protein n=2 Tax=Halodesulfovibrio aestuarii TaxID=126333 RepID=A0A8G2CDB1_9BACT|nr:phage/plasmid primase, P4 family [Halodesulfovibrio aestuarii]SHJ77843.1 phage/plasmid primase, P4 family, C-terminal domain-containing protein [Halodesulfovibrio aestuarii]
MSHSKKSTRKNSVTKHKKSASTNSSPSNSPLPTEDNAQTAAPELTVAEIAQLSCADLRALIQKQVEEERQQVWEQTKKNYPNKENHPKRLNDELKTPPPAVMAWKVMHVPEKRGPRIDRLMDAVRRQQLGDAELLVDLIGDRFCFDHKREVFMQFVNSHWKDDAKRQHRKEVTIMAEQFDRGSNYLFSKYKELESQIEQLSLKISQAGDEPEQADLAAIAKKRKELKQNKYNRKMLDDRASKLRNDRRISGVINMAKSGEDTLGIEGTEWDKDHTLLPCANGIIDLETGHLLPPDPKYKMRHASPYEYRGLHEEAPFWTDFLYKIFCNNIELLEYFERVIGYAVTGLTSHKEIYIAIGPTANNGKSSLFNTIMKVLGGYSSTISKSVLLQGNKKNDGADPALMALEGLRMAVASEPDSSETFDKEIIKQITGADEVSTRGLYESQVVLQLFCKLFVHANSVPRIKNADRALFERMRLIPFNARFTKNLKEVDEAKHIYHAKPSNTVNDRIEEEAPGILSWLVRCARTFLSDLDLTPPLIVRHEVESYTEDNDPIGAWVDDWCEVHPHDSNVRTKANDLYESFKCYCMEELKINEKYLMNNKGFGSQLTQRFKKKKIKIFYYFGISIKAGFKAEERPSLPK